VADQSHATKNEPPAPRAGDSSFRYFQPLCASFGETRLRLRTRAAAHRRVVEADVARAARLAAGAQALAAGLDHRRAGLVARRAGDAHAVLRVLALAVATAQIALAALNAVPGAIDRAQAVAEHLAQILQGAAGHFVFAAAVDLEAAGALLEFNRAAWQHAPVGRRWRATGNRPRLPTLAGAAKWCDRRCASFEQHT
jgi:hypothetical protein